MVRQKFFAASSLILCGSLALGVMMAAGKPAGDAAKGKEAFEQCAVCHNVDTDEKKMGPSLKGLFKHKALASGKAGDRRECFGADQQRRQWDARVCGYAIGRRQSEYPGLPAHTVKSFLQGGCAISGVSLCFPPAPAFLS